MSDIITVISWVGPPFVGFILGWLLKPSAAPGAAWADDAISHEALNDWLQKESRKGRYE